jgi:single-strand DNA-binding protein
MSGVNKAIILGNVGTDPEIRSMPNGNKVASFSVATSEKWKDKNTGEQQEATEWHRITIFGRLAEIVEQYVKKGSKLYLEGKIKTDKYEKEGVTHYSTSVIANQMQMLDSAGSSQSQANNQHSNHSAQQAPNTGTQQSQQAAPSNFDNFDDDIPF